MAFAPAAAAAGASIVGSVLGGKSQKKAATQAANIATQDNVANRAFLTDMYHQNAGALSPWMQSGNTANNAMMELLGFGPQTQAGAFGNPATANGNTDMGTNYDPGMGPFAGQSYSPGGMMPPAAGGVTTAAPTARSAFDTYRGSTGYDFRFNEGVRGLQSAFSHNLESGAASKAALRFGQGIASDEFSRYMQMLGQQSQQGFGAASALAGVGQSFANNVVAGNQSAATASANARLYAGNANANMWSGIGSSFGQVAGAFGK